MLKFMRERMGKTFLFLIVVGISVVFVFFGVFPSTMDGGATGTTIANVGGEKISARELEKAVNRELENYRALGMDVPQDLIENIRRGTLDGLVQGKLMIAEAKRLGIQASDREVTEEIQRIPDFQDKNKKTFSVDLYKKVLGNYGMTPGQFETDVRESLTYQRMQRFLADRIRVTPLEVEREFQLSNETRNLSFVRFTREDAMKKIKVDPAAVKAFLDDKSKEAQINGYYAQNNVKYNQPEKVCARHILKRVVPGNTDPKPPKDFLDWNPTPATFVKVAEKHSEDPGSKTKGGDLDCFPRGVMDKAFEDAAFSLAPGKVSAPVRSQFGWHYLLVSKKVPAVSRSLESVKTEIAEDLIRREKVEEIRKINVAAAEEALKSWPPKNAKVDTTGEFNGLEGNIPKIGRAEEIIKAAFDPKAKIQTGPQMFEAAGGVIVAVLKDKKSADMKKFTQEKELHARTLKERKLRAFLPAWMEDVKSRVKVSYNTRALGQM